MKNSWRGCPRRPSSHSQSLRSKSVVVAVVEPAMVAAGAFAARDTGFLRTPLLSTWKSVWTKLPARGPTVRKSYRCSRWNGMLSAIFRSRPRLFFPAYTSVLPFCFFFNFTARSSIFGSSTLRDAEQAKNLVLNSPRILLNYKNGKICISYPEDTLRIQGRIHIQIFYLRAMAVAVVCLDSR